MGEGRRGKSFDVASDFDSILYSGPGTLSGTFTCEASQVKVFWGKGMLEKKTWMVFLVEANHGGFLYRSVD